MLPSDRLRRGEGKRGLRPAEGAGILTRSIPPLQDLPPANRWRRELAHAVRDVGELLALLDLPRHDSALLAAQDNPFPLLVPRPFLARMRRGDCADPLLRQVLPLRAEAQTAHGYGPDPLAEAAATLTPGLLQKYRGRALLIAAPACAVHCRYCFRRHFPYDAAAGHGRDQDVALARIRADAGIQEVILSGGDPLMLSDARLQALVQSLCDIDHVRLLRVHTRLPVVIPNRVTAGLLAALGSRLRTTLVLHINHPQEIDAELARATRLLRSVDTTLLNQTVLLRGVNDTVAALAELSLGLHEIGVLPYYLHLPDKVAGTAHFDVSARRGRALIAALRARLPGYLVPRLAREVPGEASKRVLA